MKADEKPCRCGNPRPFRRMKCGFCVEASTGRATERARLRRAAQETVELSALSESAFEARMRESLQPRH